MDFGAALLERLQPFLYRRYLDFTALAGLRRVKALMDAEQGRASQDIKKGQGGIREIEFIVQSLQLIHGGRLPQLRQRNTLQSLAQIGAAGLLQANAIATLRQQYCLWRRVEHALQMIDDRQTQALPNDPLSWARLACALGLDSADGLQEEIASGRTAVHALFREVLPTTPGENQDDPANLAWLAARHALDENPPEGWQQLLPGDGDGMAWQELRRFARSRRVLQLSQRGQARLDALVPPLLRRLAAADHPGTLLHRNLELLDALLGQPQYLALLAENPHWLGRLEELLASPWLSQELTRFPTLLEDVLCQRSAAARDWPQLFSSTEDEGRDLEERMDLLRRFKNTETLLLASDFWAESKDIDSLLTELSELASFCLQRALPWAIEAMLQQHGPLPGYPEIPFAIIAYGKLGGMEMGLASDLDLVFLYDMAPELESAGRIPLPAATWFARLGQKLIHILSVLTRAGTLYEIDMRLRPSGQSGPLVSSLAAFQKYQRESAWTWEHQALTRARFIAGDPGSGKNSPNCARKSSPNAATPGYWPKKSSPCANASPRKNPSLATPFTSNGAPADWWISNFSYSLLFSPFLPTIPRCCTTPVRARPCRRSLPSVFGRKTRSTPCCGLGVPCARQKIAAGCASSLPYSKAPTQNLLPCRVSPSRCGNGLYDWA